jgi:hypothetical protein
VKDEEKHPPLLNMKVDDSSIGEEQHCFFDANQNPISMDDFRQKNCTARFILHFSMVYFVGNNFGVSCKIAQAQLIDRPQIGCMFDRFDKRNDGGARRLRSGLFVDDEADAAAQYDYE